MRRQSCVLANRAVRFRLFLAAVVALDLCLLVPVRGNVVGFDDIPKNGTNTVSVPPDYQGLQWNNFDVLNAIDFTNFFSPSGYYNGMVSPSNVVYNNFAEPAGVGLENGNFDFFSAYVTAAWVSNLTLQVQGFQGGTLLYSTNVILNWTGPTLVVFNFVHIDELLFNSFGGIDVGLAGNNSPQFVMDNFSFAFDPAAPAFVSVTIVNRDVVLTFPTVFNNVSNIFYDVQSSTDLLAGVWSTIASNIPGTGAAVTYTDAAAAAVSRRFYRVGSHY